MGGYSVSFRDKNGRLICRNYDINSFFFRGIYTAEEMAKCVKERLEVKGYTEIHIRDRESKLQSYNSYITQKPTQNDWKARLRIG